jgi:hypothetical protein
MKRSAVCQESIHGKSFDTRVSTIYYEVSVLVSKTTCNIDLRITGNV